MNRPAHPALLAAARSLFAYLSATDSPPEHACDAVIGFGTFDLTLAAFCGELHTRGLARQIILTGGIGAGTADLGRPEADAWRDEILRTHPAIDPRSIVAENRSTNTSENIEFTSALLAREHPELAFGRGIRTALIVASPSRLRRVKLTLRHRLPELRVFRLLPAADFDREFELHESKGISYFPHLAGEIDRIRDYPTRGWIAAEPLPSEILAARHQLK
mgnify:CR=1 FL=1